MGSIEDTPETVGMLGKKLPTFRIILIEVRCNADSRYTNGSQHAERNENHRKKSKQKLECTDNGHNRCLGGDAEEYGGKEVCAS